MNFKSLHPRMLVASNNSCGSTPASWIILGFDQLEPPRDNTHSISQSLTQRGFEMDSNLSPNILRMGDPKGTPLFIPIFLLFNIQKKETRPSKNRTRSGFHQFDFNLLRLVDEHEINRPPHLPAN
jgi:hypothetical protein